MKEVLPHKLSDLLEIAVNDAEALQVVPGVTLNMSSWLVNDPRLKSCSVCMAGAVMLRRGLVTKEIPTDKQEFYPGDCSGNVAALVAINDMRTGSFTGAADRLGLNLSRVMREELKKIRDRVGSVYNSDKGNGGLVPWPVYRSAIQDLRKLGL